MPTTLTLTLKTEGWQRGLDRLIQQYPQAVNRALTRAATSARVVMVREVARDLGIKQGDVTSAIGSPRVLASGDRMAATIVATGARIALYKFRARQTRTGVTAKLPTGAGTYPGAFIATMASGHVGVFKRKGSARKPIFELFGPSVPKVFDKYMPLGLARGQEQLVKNLVHELRFALAQSAA